MKGRPIGWLPEELDFIKERRDWDRATLHKALCFRFGRKDVSLKALSALCKRKGWLTGRSGCFQKGQIPANKGKRMPFNANSAATQFKKGQRTGRANALYQPIGSERLSKDGYLQRKINDDMPFQRRWRGVHLIRWEELNGPLPEGYALKCLDGDKSNTDPSNWRAIPRGMLPRLNGRWNGLAYDDAPAELRPTILAAAELDHAARELRRKVRSDSQRDAPENHDGERTHAQ